MSGRAARLCLIAALGALLYLPNLGTAELDKEEGRRAVPAREMLDSGDWVQPTIWGRPYFSKPPLYFWSVAAVGAATGGVDELATRLPSALCTIATALLVFLLVDRAAGRREAWAAGLLALFGFTSLEKGYQGELEPMLVLTAFASGAFLWLGRGRRLGWELASGVALGLALLTKGPPALVFFGAAALGARVARTDERPARVWIPLALGVAIAASWAAALLVVADPDAVLAQWWGQQANRRSDSYLGDRLDFVVGYGAGLLPSLLFAGLLARTAPGAAARRQPFVRFALVAFAVASAFFLVFPATRPRYAYPAAPWLSVAAGVMLARATAAADATAGRRVRAVSAAVLAAGLLVVPVAAWLLFRPIDVVRGLDPLGWAVVAAMAVVSAGGLRRLRRDRAWTGLAAAAALVAGVRTVQTTQVVPQAAHVFGRAETARPLRAALPADADVRLRVPKRWNPLFYVGRRFRWIEDWADLEPGQWLVVPCADVPDARAGYAGTLEAVLETDVDGLAVCVLAAR